MSGALLKSLIFIVAAACASSTSRPARTPSDSRVIAGMVPTAENMAVIYHQMGLMATDAPLPFVGKIAYFATPSPDTTLVLVAMSFANKSLTFTRENEQFSAPYEVRIVFSRDTARVQSITSTEVVRVAGFREIARADESVIFQRFVRLAPGPYQLSLALRDGGSARAASQQGVLHVPSMTAATFSTPLAVYEARQRASLDSVPRLLPTPRSSATFGLDSGIVLYLEGYGSAASTPVRFTITNERKLTTWTDTVTLKLKGSISSRVVSVPIGRAGLGVSTVSVSRLGGQDTVSTRIFVGFGPEIPLMSYEDLLLKLRYFASSERIRNLRETPVDDRGRAWAAFRQATDPIPSTTEHEGLQSYFSRIAIADIRFRNSGEMGWVSDRGAVFATLGEPDQIFEQLANQNRSVFSGSGRIQIWEYGQYNARLVFVDSGVGRWQLSTASQGEFASLSSRVLAR